MHAELTFFLPNLGDSTAMDLLHVKWELVYPEPGRDSIMGMKADKTAAGCLKVLSLAYFPSSLLLTFSSSRHLHLMRFALNEILP